MILLLGSVAWAADDPLTLEAWLDALVNTDPAVTEARHRAAARDSAAAALGDRSQTELVAAPRIGGGLDLIGRDQVWFGTGTTGVAALERVGRKGAGGTVGIMADGRAPTFLRGPSAVVYAEGRVPLGANAAGRLWALESEVARLEAQAAHRDAALVRRERCLLGTELFVTAASLQAQTALYADFVTTKERSVARTRRDVRRGLLRRLELLTAESDLSQTRTEQLTLEQERDTLLAAMGTWLATPPGAVDEADLATWAHDELAVADHPWVASLAARASARTAQAAVVDRSYQGTVDLGPRLTASHQAGLLDATGAPTTFTEATAELALEIRLPLAVPRRAHEIAVQQSTADASTAAAGEATRSLAESAARARAALTGTQARLAMVEERLAVIQAQVDAAWREFLDGRLEYQDWAQHYALFQSTQLDRARLQLEADLARITLAGATHELPEVCR